MRAAIILFLSLLGGSVLFAQDTVSVPVMIQIPPGTKAIHADDFKVTLAGKQTTVTSLQSLANRPLHYVLLHDLSGSEKKNQKNGTLNTAPELLLKEIIKPIHDRGSLVNFSIRPYIDVEESEDPSTLVAKLDRTPNGGSAIFDAVAASADYLAKHPWQLASRDVLFLFTDGGDNASSMGLANAIDHLATMKIPILVFLTSFDDTGRSRASMYQLAAATGGRIYNVSTPQSAAAAVAQAKADLQNSFLLNIAIPNGTKAHSQKLVIESPSMKIFAPPVVIIPAKR